MLWLMFSCSAVKWGLNQRGDLEVLLDCLAKLKSERRETPNCRLSFDATGSSNSISASNFAKSREIFV